MVGKDKLDAAYLLFAGAKDLKGCDAMVVALLGSIAASLTGLLEIEVERLNNEYL